MLSRASDFYVTVTIIPGVLITLLSFAVFYSDTASADPLGCVAHGAARSVARFSC